MKMYLKPIRYVSGRIILGKHHKPYWDDELDELWRKSFEKETTFRKFKGANHVKKQLKNEYNISLKYFDKMLRQKESTFRRNKILDIESMSCTDHREFWQNINKLGPKKKVIK